MFGLLYVQKSGSFEVKLKPGFAVPCFVWCGLQILRILRDPRVWWNSTNKLKVYGIRGCLAVPPVDARVSLFWTQR